MESYLATPEDLHKEARAFTARLVPKDKGATLVTLSGELGAGKTTFVQEVAKTLGIQESVTSPTFVLEKVYQLTRQPLDQLIHIDAYRLHSAQELTAIGFLERMKQPRTLILLEWPEHVVAILPPQHIRIGLQVCPSGGRTIRYDTP